MKKENNLIIDDKIKKLNIWRNIFLCVGIMGAVALFGVGVYTDGNKIISLICAILTLVGLCLSAFFKEAMRNLEASKRH